MIFGIRAVIEAVEAGKEIDRLLIKKDMQPIAKMELEHYMTWIDEVSE